MADTKIAVCLIKNGSGEESSCFSTRLSSGRMVSERKGVKNLLRASTCKEQSKKMCSIVSTAPDEQGQSLSLMGMPLNLPCKTAEGRTLQRARVSALLRCGLSSWKRYSGTLLWKTGQTSQSAESASTGLLGEMIRRLICTIMPARQKMLLVVLIHLVWTPDLAAHGHDPASPEVLTKHGRLRGQQIYIGEVERHVSVFLGIPFAKPPVGPLRFSPPEPPEPWTDVRNSTSYPPICLQDPVMGQQLSDDFTNRKEKLSFTMSENCLYLNIYTPATPETKEKLPVMVWIHGGGLAIGAASTYDGSVLAAFENVIVVTIQYRLNILGFFSTGDEFARGNWGLLDQVAALQWIQENIADFGGDPKSVTIFGESSGGASVSFLVLSPLAKNLFHKAISESGAAFIDPSPYHPAETAKKTAASAGCDPTMTTAEMVHCLREKTEEEILNVTLKLGFMKLDLTGEQSILLMPPVVDGVFLPKSGLELYTAKEINGVPYMIGVTNHEFGWLLPNLLTYPNFTTGLDTEAAFYILKGMSNFMNVPPDHVHILTEEYLAGTEDPFQLRDRLADLIGDFLFIVPCMKIAKHHRDAGNPVYFYEFQHRPSSYAGIKPEYVRSDHGDEIGFVFGKPFLAGDATEEERNLSRKVMSYWANFARTGDPNGEGLVPWPPFDQNEPYLEIGLQQSTAHKLREKQVMFWTTVLPQKLAEYMREGSDT